jgi:hypothetical protein
MECIHLALNSLLGDFCKHGNEIRATINSGELVTGSWYIGLQREQGFSCVVTVMGQKVAGLRC